VQRVRIRVEGGLKMNRKLIGWEDVDLILLDMDENKWRALVTTIMNPRL
jgi:hypothetical protein